MKKKTLFKLLFALFFVLPMFSMGAGNTAMNMLPKAISEAKKWQADAALLNITTSSALTDGTGAWAFTFLSPKTGQKILIIVDDNGEASQFDSSYYRDNVVGEFTVDSDKAMAEAIKNGLKTHNFGMKMNLENYNGLAEWRLQDNENFYYIDANSGKFLRKEKNE